VPISRPVRPMRAGLTIAAVLALVAACSGSAAVPSPTPVEITAAPTQPPSPSAAASPSPSEAVARGEGGPSSSPSIKIQGTTGKVVNETDGYTITLPDGWLRLDMSAGDLTQILQSAAGMSDDMAAMMQDQAANMALSGVHFWAVKTDDVGQGFASNANIIRQPSMGVSLDLIEQLSVNQLESLDVLGGAKVAHEHVHLPAGEALRLSYAIQAKDASNADLTATIVQYLIIRDDGQFILTLTGTDADETASVADSMAKSWTFAA